MEGGFFLDVVVAEGTAVLKLLPGEDQTLLVGGNSLLVLDLRLDVVDGVAGLDIEGDGLAGEGLDKNLWAPPTTAMPLGDMEMGEGLLRKCPQKRQILTRKITEGANLPALLKIFGDNSCDKCDAINSFERAGLVIK